MTKHATRRKKSAPVRFACPYCTHTKHFRSIRGLNRHIGQDHSGEPLVRPRRWVPIY